MEEQSWGIANPTAGATAKTNRIENSFLISAASFYSENHMVGRIAPPVWSSHWEAVFSAILCLLCCYLSAPMSRSTECVGLLFPFAPGVDHSVVEPYAHIAVRRIKCSPWFARLIFLSISNAIVRNGVLYWHWHRLMLALVPRVSP